MPAMTQTTPGVFNWVDLMSPDVDASVAFYTEVFGWEAEDQLDDDGETRVYVMLSKDGRTVAGLGGQMDAMHGAPAMWNSYVATDDVDATTSAVRDAGGTVVLEPMEIDDSGRMAVYVAPDGAMISAWQPQGHLGAELVNEDGAWSWNELMTRDLDRAREFYAEVFGWTYGEQDMGPMGTYYLGTVDDRQMCGLMRMPPEVPDAAPNHWGVYFTVDDVAAAVAAVEQAGGTVVSPPNHMPGVGTMAMVHDPQGGSFSLMQPEPQG